MRRDTFKTVGGVIIIGAIVVATFLYGNHQRQNQVEADRQAKEQHDQPKQQPAAASQPAASSQSAPASQPSAPAQPAANPTAAAQPAQTPDTGSELLYLVPGVAIILLYRAKRASAGAVRTALLA